MKGAGFLFGVVLEYKNILTWAAVKDAQFRESTKNPDCITSFKRAQRVVYEL